MASNLPLLFFVGALGGFTLLAAGIYYYFRSGENPLSRRMQELQEQSATGSSIPVQGGDFFDALLRATFGTLFGKTWFRQKELELMRAGFRGPKVVKVYGVASLGFMVILVIGAI